MMPNKPGTTIAEQFLKAILISFSVGGLLYAQSVYAEIPTLDLVVARLSQNMPELVRTLTSFAYIIGTYFVILGVIEMKHFGESRGMMSQEHGLKKPLLYFFVGAALIYLPSSIKTGTDTLWGGANSLAYVPEVGNAFSELRGNAFVILQFIGLVAFIRGLVIMTQLGGHGGQPGTFARGMTHIIGGILCINMYDTVNMILVSLGMEGIIDGSS